MKKWALKDVIELVTAMQGKISKCGYHTTITIESLKGGDTIDLYLVPIEGGAALPVDTLMWMCEKFGKGKAPVRKTVPGVPAAPRVRTTNDEFLYTYRYAFTLGELTINVYVV